ncbi:1-deoxy-D-xylulose-5-phosphate synthase [Cumulibacter soli]|uniref:1-deoxy-D-xylulose-5-phosphate synthase n=1 Tax=Cumulibacter soli TaxID=2546344 RepID=UPI001ABAA085|nr:1-deoxy-D-xylulose-5-phosphate synthase [Cumulibacter soli]
MSLLTRINGPAALRELTSEELVELSAEIREFLITKISKLGGHLGPNLGVVELTIALHRVFDSPREPIVWDTGHQSYVHKMLTGRQGGFDALKQRGGLSGYPSRAESEHDWSESSHASASLSYVDGLSKAFDIAADPRPVVGVIGDGALTGGMAWEALNNIAESDRPVVIVVNDNGWSYSPTIGGLASRLAALRLKPNYERTLGRMKERISGTPVVGPVVYDALHGVKTGIKDMISPQGMFADLDFKYVGPVDGHDIGAVERALRLAKDFGAPVIVHCVTRKGAGYEPAETDEEDRLHGVSAFDRETGKSVAKSGATWTGAFSDLMVELGSTHEDLVAITAAMLHPTGLAAFAERFPTRTFDVGIAEQHALTSAAGLAMGGMHPVVALYSTFLNRAFDQLVMDIALHQQPVTICLDRAGITGSDGPSHNGVWDLALLSGVPGIRIGAPRDGSRLRELLCEAVNVDDGPTVLRWDKGALPANLPSVQHTDGYDLLVRAERRDVALVAIGSLAHEAADAAARLAAQGIGVSVFDPRWAIPVSPALVEELSRYRLVVTLEDGLVSGGIGSRISQAMRAAGIDVPCRELGVPSVFPEHASRSQILTDLGLDADGVTHHVVTWFSAIRGPRDAAPIQIDRAASEGE